MIGALENRRTKARVSWDIYIMNFPLSVKKVADIPDDLTRTPLGSRDDLIKQIQEALPGADFSDPTWGDFVQDGCSIEFNMGSDSICDSIMLHVREGGEPATIIAAVLDRLKLRAIDCQTGEFFDVEPAKASFNSWQQYRDQIVGRKAKN